MSQRISKLVEYLETNNYEMAIQSFNERQQQLSESYYLQLARAYFVQEQYENCCQLCEKLKKSDDPKIRFDSLALLIKAQYLSGVKVSKTIQELEEYVSTNKNRINNNCFESVREIKQAISYDLNLPASSMNKNELKQFGKQFKNLYQKQCYQNPLTDCMPMFIVSSRWFRILESYIGLNNSSNGNGAHPGPITHFQILDHRYNMLYDPTLQKKYTNYLIYPGAAAIALPRSCWLMLKQKFRGFQLKRYNVWVSGKPRQIMTEIYLKKIKIRRQNEKFVFEAQITKKQTWGGFIKKIKSIWRDRDTFTVLQELGEDQYKPVSETQFLQEINTQDKVYVFGEPSKQLKSTLNQTASILSRCQKCGRTKDLKFCQCKSVKYCDAKCQKEDREKHRKKCELQSGYLNQKSAALENFNLPERAYGGRKGLVGLKNLGNTCYMNSGLQCMSNTKQITEYFMRNDFIKQINHSNPLGTKGNLSCAYAELIRQMWTGSDSSISPFNLKKIIGKFAGQFSGYGQQDSQQFISYLIDGLQEDLNLVKKKQTFETPDDIVPDEEGSRRSQQNYEKRIKSYIRDLMVGQFKSTVICEKCTKKSICFDPYLLLALPIPGLKQNQVFYISMDCSKPTKRLTFTSDSFNKMSDLRRQMNNFYGVQPNARLMFSVVQLKKFAVLAFDIKDSATINEVSNKITNSDVVLIAYQIQNPKAKEETYEIVYLYEGEKKCFPRYINIGRQAQNNELASVISQSILRHTKSRDVKDVIDSLSKNVEKRTITINLRKSVDMLFCSSQTKTLRLHGIEKRTNLYDCLTNFTNTETLEDHNKWYCSRCKNHERASKQMEIYKANQILVLAFKRFSRGYKVKDLIQFPIEGLNMGPFIKSNKQKRQKIYDLYGVVNHYGTMSGGHYTAYCKNFLNNEWYQFDDSRVSKINPKQTISQAAYVLFYRERK